MTWRVGDRVKAGPDLAPLYGDSPWGAKFAIPRLGTVYTVPWAAEHTGRGTLLIEWDSLTGPKADPAAWRIWLHSDLVERVPA